MNAWDYASHTSEEIEQAVDDGADIVNYPAGYPCRFLLALGTENACTTESRVLLEAKLATAVGTACSVALTTGDPLWTLACTYAYCGWDAFFKAFLVMETRGAMEDAVSFAKGNGVPVVASAGNKYSKASLPLELQPFVTDAD